MCGIAGMMGFSERDEAPARIARAMGDALAHRGPDDHGEWVDVHGQIALAHRRLSIVDLSPLGHQPMHSRCGRWVIAFNGEIYNHRDIRAELDSRCGRVLWRSLSDTETLVESIALIGIDETLKRCAGMFAFAVWDRKDRELHLCRDRFGEKPLYYGWLQNCFVFGSELKALRQHPKFNCDIERGALALFMRHNYVPAPYCIYSGIAKLPAGAHLKLGLPNLKQQSSPKPRHYWSAINAAENAICNRYSATTDDATIIDELEFLLRSTIREQMVADVPLGAFLSGGIDSSLIVSLMQAQSSRPVKTFSIGFNESAFNEANHARAVAQHLNTEHTEFIVSAQQAREVIPLLPTIYDEPFADVSQIPTYLVAKLARQHVTVALSGDAGDELFGGYNRYSWGRNIWRRIGPLPRSLRSTAAAMLDVISPESWDKIYRAASLAVPAIRGYGSVGDKLQKLAGVIDAHSPEDMYRRLVSHWRDPSSALLGNVVEPYTDVLAALTCKLDITERMMLLDTLTYMPDDILAKVDRATMAVSLESRVPLLNHRVFEFAWRMPLSAKVRDGRGKWALRKILYRYVPANLIERPKMGFGVPIGDWLRGPLREWGGDLLDATKMRQQGFLKVDAVHKKWHEHQRGIRNWQYLLWDVLMFQSWLQSQSGR